MRNLSRWLAPLALMVVAATGCKKTETAASDTPKAGEPVPSATGGAETPEPTPSPDPVAEPTPEPPEPPEPTPTDPPPATPTEPATAAAPQPFLKLADRACACKTSACAMKAQREFEKAQSVVRLTEEAYRAVTRERARLDACVAKLAGEPGDTGGGSGGALPAQGRTCDAKDRCAKGLQCIKYYGIAGASGPQFRSCEIPCPGGKGCPSGQTCTTIADGPGEVCRPKS